MSNGSYGPVKTHSPQMSFTIFPSPKCFMADFIPTTLWNCLQEGYISNTNEGSPLVEKESSFCLCFNEWPSDTGICYLRSACNQSIQSSETTKQNAYKCVRASDLTTQSKKNNFLAKTRQAVQRAVADQCIYPQRLEKCLSQHWKIQLSNIFNWSARWIAFVNHPVVKTTVKYE